MAVSTPTPTKGADAHPTTVNTTIDLAAEKLTTGLGEKDVPTTDDTTAGTRTSSCGSDATTTILSTSAVQLARLQQLKDRYGATWSSPSDPRDPYNWRTSRKVCIGILISVGQLVAIMSASMIAASLDDIMADLGVGEAAAQLVLSTYFLGLGLGPFLVAGVAEMHGRKHVWLAAQLFFVFWNALCPVGNSTALMIVGRFLAGAGASAGVTLTGPIMADMFRAEDRGMSIAIAQVLPYLGPSLGPVVGGVATQYVRWQWTFWIVCVFSAVLTLVVLAVVPESYTPVLLRRLKEAAESAQAGGPASTASRLGPSWRRPRLALPSGYLALLGTNLMRPIRMLVHRPIIQIVCTIIAFDFGVYSIMLSTLATLWIHRYGQTKLVASLHYISITIGCIAATQSGGYLMDWTYKKLVGRERRRVQLAAVGGQPEFRLPNFVPGMILMAAGLFWYGWAAEGVVHWAVVDAGVLVFNAGSFLLSQSLMAYQLDEFGDHAASAGAATRLPMYTLAFVFPIFAPKLYDALGYGWGNSLLGFLWIVLAFPIPLVLWVWGPRLRAIGRKDGEHGVASL
ncbi:major facilitator superfamily domain-containing protein [Lasiosphaeria miniovina]|uniref:Major facilitator superfamily domain-containing protein n=1 Tax=Lasiosphaeria miniovina TaxID=1954250 RepID=A0AA39ZYS9_9PEZI|nr:major facilitator superfamily domain-containing protein [Lasiosphaeria miniovina]KAK0706136.1 major facilitator superfamily domain-containing protein [Lasiosphaeria miniovina]